MNNPRAAARSPLVARLHADYEVARHAAFAVFARVGLEQRGLVPALLTRCSSTASRLSGASLTGALADLCAANPHLLAYFRSTCGAIRLPDLEPDAVAELTGWCAAQRVDREPAQVAYELGMLALGIELPGILVGALRSLALGPDMTVVELPDGGGYPTVFLTSLHPLWDASRHARLFVEGPDAESLAGWALAVIGQSAAPPAGRVVRVTQGTAGLLRDSPYDVALVYNPVAWLGDGGASAASHVQAREVVLL